MAKRSSIEQLPPEILAAAEEMWASKRFTLTEMVERINAMEPPSPVSRSALGRKTQDWDEQLAEIRQARDMARSWKAAIANDPDGDIGSVLGEQLNTMAIRVVRKLNPAELDLAGMAKAAKMGRDLATTDKLRADRELQAKSAQASPLDVIATYTRRLMDRVSKARPELAEAFLAVLEDLGEEMAKEFA